MNSTGIVMKVENKKACILTNDGQFVNVMIKGKVPVPGEVYAGKKAISIFSLKRTVAAASILFTVLMGSLAYTYNAEASSVIFNASPDIKLSVNRWGMIIKAQALNEDGKKVLAAVNIKNKSLNAGLDSIVNEAKKENLITQDYDINSMQQDKIEISVKNHKNGVIPNLNEFEKHMKEKNLNIKVENQKYKDNETISNKNHNYEKSNQINEKIDNKENLDENQNSNETKNDSSIKTNVPASKSSENSSDKVNSSGNNHSGNSSQDSTSHGNNHNNNLNENKGSKK